ncbi:MAG: ferritin-like domain-containing protein, partial [Thermomicrobia bacterium]|nr:ferritin-like domain-containing protein [Thermomicrobia bacterium]
MADFTNDLDILNYALTLEHLETQMYKDIIASGKLTGDEQGYATQFGAHEAAHVQALTQTIQKLGGTPVAAQAKYNFPAFDTRDNIVKFLVTVEDLGAAAYLGAAADIKSPDLLTVAVQIHNIEGEHASIWRRQNKVAPVAGAFAAPATKADVLKAAGPILGASGGSAAPAATGTAGATTSTGTGGATTSTGSGGATTSTGTGGATTSTGTGGATTSTGGGTTVMPQTGAPKQETNNSVTAAVVAGVAAVGVGAALRARSYKRDPKAATNGDN